ncbi:hypothetical protein QTH91_14590 [Variovorax dokdonensis]|uniref:Uncharacterized protein n=1 Tax=Variovorax dokdonensis TaxID=344883 RepID=A0ABT7NCV2_9BURK|nr:hypothetical protein [Variovorax dokdonensis]MDM0045715.1 hypothetical protein [Variovorax dokdonensis]
MQAEIAQAQAEAARNKLRLELFEKRLAAHTAITEYIRKSLAGVKAENLDAIAGTTTMMNWLFKDDVHDWFARELAPAIAKLSVAQLKLIAEPGDVAVVVEHSGASMEAVAQFGRLNEVMRPYLTLED